MNLNDTQTKIVIDSSYDVPAMLIPVPLANEMLNSIGFFLEPRSHNDLIRFYNDMFGEKSPIVLKRMIERTLQLRREE